MGMPTGDSLTNAWGFTALIGAAVIAAIQTPAGRTRNWLWLLAIGLALAGAATLLSGARLDQELIGRLLPPLYPLATVLIVVLYVRPAPAQAKAEISQPLAAPNMKLEVALVRIARSVWARDHQPEPEAIVRELQDKLYLKRLSAFGRPSLGEPPTLISWKRWKDELTLDMEGGTAVNRSGAVVFHDIQVNSDAISHRWPQPND